MGAFPRMTSLERTVVGVCLAGLGAAVAVGVVVGVAIDRLLQRG